MNTSDAIIYRSLYRDEIEPDRRRQIIALYLLIESKIGPDIVTIDDDAFRLTLDTLAEYDALPDDRQSEAILRVLATRHAIGYMQDTGRWEQFCEDYDAELAKINAA